jgi:hypothetical protein
VTIPDEPLVA